MIVLDASVLVEALLDDGATGERGRAAIDAAGPLHAPDHITLEAASAIRRAVRAGRADAVRATTAIEDLLALPATYHSQHPLLPRIWQLRDRCTPYDAAYVALALALDVPLLTADQQLARGVGDICRVELLVNES